MQIGLIQIDGKLPNLALMKISAWYKAQGHSTILLKPSDVLDGIPLFDVPDKLYAATIFDWSRPVAEKLKLIGAEVGGVGWSLDNYLPPEVEAMKPDYDLYSIDYGMGFSSRGCIRKCKFCVVWQKEGYIREVCMPSDLGIPRNKKLVLLDNNFLASPLWREKCQNIIDNKYKVDFCQGLDIRLVNEENAAYLAEIKHQKQIRFAFDDIKLEPIIHKKIEILVRAGIKPYRLMFYILVNYNSSFQEDLKRIEIIEKYDADPFVMVYNKVGAPRQIKDLATWCNKPWYRKSCRFSEYRRTG